MFLGDEQIGFQCFANYTPIRPGTTPIFHSNRTVIHPDYCGLGLGNRVISITSKFMKEKYKFKIMAKFSSTPVFKAMIKDKNWKFLGEKRVMGKTVKGGMMQRVTGFREGGVKTYHFEFIG